MYGALLGFACGFLGSMPVSGPIALIVFRLSLRQEFSQALRLVAGAAVAEMLYCAGAIFGYTRIVAAWPHVAGIIRIVGAGFLILLGLIFLFQKFSVEEKVASPVGEPESIFRGFTLALLNPTLFLTWSSVTGTIFSWTKNETFIDLVMFPLCAGLGIFTWFALFLKILKRFREKIGIKLARGAIRVAALFMVGSGIYMALVATKILSR